MTGKIWTVSIPSTEPHIKIISLQNPCSSTGAKHFMIPTTSTFKISPSRVMDGAVSIKLWSGSWWRWISSRDQESGLLTICRLSCRIDLNWKSLEAGLRAATYSTSTQSWWTINPDWLSDCVMMMNNQTCTRTRTRTQAQPVNQPVVVCVVLVDGWVVSRRGAETEGHMMTANFLLNTQ